MARRRDYRESLLKSLKDAREAEAYLNASLEENDPNLFLVALRNVAEARGGMSRFAREAGLNRENLYRVLSKKGNPRLSSLSQLLNAMGFRLSVGIKRRAS